MARTSGDPGKGLRAPIGKHTGPRPSSSAALPPPHGHTARTFRLTRYPSRDSVEIGSDGYLVDRARQTSSPTKGTTVRTGSYTQSAMKQSGLSRVSRRGILGRVDHDVRTQIERVPCRMRQRIVREVDGHIQLVFFIASGGLSLSAAVLASGIALATLGGSGPGAVGTPILIYVMVGALLMGGAAGRSLFACRRATAFADAVQDSLYASTVRRGASRTPPASVGSRTLNRR